MKKKVSYLLPLIALIPVIALILYLYSFLGGPNSGSVTLSLDEPWMVTVGDTLYENANLKTLKFPLTQRGEELYLSTTLPETQIVSPMLNFYSVHETVDIYIDGQKIYSYGHEDYKAGRSLGYGNHYIVLPTDYMGKLLEIRLTVSEPNSYSFIHTPLIACQNEYYKDTLISYRTVLASNLFLYVFGIFFLLISIFFLFKSLSFYRLTCIAMFSVCVSTWSICYDNLISFLTYNLRMKTLCEFGCLYLAPLFIFTYFAQDALKKSGNRFRKVSYLVIETFLVVFNVVTFPLQFLDIRHFPEFLGISHLLISLVLVYVLYMFIDDIRRRQFNHSFLMFGLIALMVFSAIDLVTFNLQRYTSYVTNAGYASYLYIGTLLFVLSLFGDFCSGVMNTLYDNATKQTLEKLAYADFLTGLANRRQCEILFDELDEAHAPYILITFDLNDLKRINDSLGHLEGDRYIKAFSTVLQDTFKDLGLIARMGGDEFIVIITETEKADISALTATLLDNMEEVNRQNNRWNMSAAYGIYHSSEEYAGASRDAFRIADARMYDKKSEMKRTEL